MSEMDSTLSLGGGGCGVSGESSKLESKLILGGGVGGVGVVSGESSELESKSSLGGGGVSGESSKLESKDEKWKGMTLQQKIKLLGDGVLTKSERRALLLEMKKDKPFIENGYDIDDNGALVSIRPSDSDDSDASEILICGNYDWGAWDAERMLEDPDFIPDEDFSCWDVVEDEDEAESEDASLSETKSLSKP